MPEAEKWAWFTLAVIALTVAAYFAMAAFIGFGPATGAAFSLLALTAVPALAHRRRRLRDERDKAFAHTALLTSLCVFWVSFVMVPVALGFIKGWDHTVTVPLWMLSDAVYVAALLVVGVQAVTLIVLYRRGSHA